MVWLLKINWLDIGHVWSCEIRCPMQCVCIFNWVSVEFWKSIYIFFTNLLASFNYISWSLWMNTQLELDPHTFWWVLVGSLILSPCELIFAIAKWCFSPTTTRPHHPTGSHDFPLTISQLLAKHATNITHGLPPHWITTNTSKYWDTLVPLNYLHYERSRDYH